MNEFNHLSALKKCMTIIFITVVVALQLLYLCCLDAFYAFLGIDASVGSTIPYASCILNTMLIHMSCTFCLTVQIACTEILWLNFRIFYTNYVGDQVN